MIVEFKDELDLGDLQNMSDVIVMIMFEFMAWTKLHKLPCRVTSMMEHVDGRVFNSHTEGRSFDSSLRGWTISDIDLLTEHFNEKYKDIAAISSTDYVPRLVVDHGKGANYHMHWQVHPRFKVAQ